MESWGSLTNKTKSFASIPGQKSTLNLHSVTDETMTEWKFRNDSILSAYKKPKFSNIEEFVTHQLKKQRKIGRNIDQSSESSTSSFHQEIPDPNYDNPEVESDFAPETEGAKSQKKVKKQKKNKAVNRISSKRSKIAIKHKSRR